MGKSGILGSERGRDVAVPLLVTVDDPETDRVKKKKTRGSHVLFAWNLVPLIRYDTFLFIA